MKGIITTIITGITLVFLLPSCEAMKDFKITGEVSYTDVETGAKGGVVFGADKPSWFIRLPSFKSNDNGLSVDIIPEISPQK